MDQFSDDVKVVTTSSFLEEVGDWDGLVDLLASQIRETKDVVLGARLYTQRADILLERQGRVDEAINHYLKASKYDPAGEGIHNISKRRRAHELLGQSMMVRNCIEYELKHAREASKPGLCHDLADVLCDLGHHDNANDYYRLASVEAKGTPLGRLASEALSDLALGKHLWTSRSRELAEAGKSHRLPKLERARLYMRAARLLNGVNQLAEGALEAAYVTYPLCPRAVACYEEHLTTPPARWNDLAEAQERALEGLSASDQARACFGFAARWNFRYKDSARARGFLERSFAAKPSEACFSLLRRIKGEKDGCWVDLADMALRGADRALCDPVAGGTLTAMFLLAHEGMIRWRGLADVPGAKRAFRALVAIAPQHPSIAAFEAESGTRVMQDASKRASTASYRKAKVGEDIECSLCTHRPSVAVSTAVTMDPLSRLQRLTGLTHTITLSERPKLIPLASRLRILHISDLHERAAFPEMPAGRQPILTRDARHRGRVLGPRFLREIADVSAGGIDIVCFTGDLADWGHPEEYKRSTERIQRILDAAGVPRERFYAVPGNHDVQRKIQENAWRGIRKWLAATADGRTLGRWFHHAMDTPPGLTAEWREQILERTSAFWNWLDEFGRGDLRPSGYSPLGYHHTIHAGTFAHIHRPIHVIGLDSAWLCGADETVDKVTLKDERSICLTDDQVDAHIRDGENGLDGFRIALVHHPLECLADQIEVRQLLADDGVDLLLHGHQHEALSVHFDEPGTSLRVLASGCLIEGDLGKHWPNGFHLVEVDVQSGAGAVHFRQWSDKSRGWAPATGLYLQARDGVLQLPPRPRGTGI